VDHPAYGGSDDIANSVAGAVNLIIAKPQMSSHAVPLGVGKVEHFEKNAFDGSGAVSAPPKTCVPVPLGVGDSGFSMGASGSRYYPQGGDTEDIPDGAVIGAKVV
jgi:hypothetical protein